ncbi:MAG TPA: cupin domain-containing protein [Hyphomicrobiales bacterium]|nr:cupin domain-containing protein [Hyphomicrobiales bacterium]
MAANDEIQERRRRYYDRIGAQNMAPLWERYHGLLTREPKIAAQPHLWRYDEARANLIEAADLISAKEAERRVLMLENPAFVGQCKALETLFTGLQLIMPGEVAPAHRHTPNALRVVLEGEGAYTSVNGEKTYMEYGDYITTPNWSWHDHGHEGTAPVIWQDILDLPLVHSLGPVFHEGYPEERFPAGPPAGDSLLRFGSNLLPVGYESARLNSPIFAYPYARTRETMETLAKTTAPDPYCGLKMEFIDPTSGGASMATISAFMQRLPKGFGTERYRSTEASVFTCLEGGGRVEIGDGERKRSFSFSKRDIFVVPCWDAYRIEAADDTYLFVGSDRVVQQKLGLFRERRGNA